VWTSGQGYLTRLTRLRTGANGVPALNASTVSFDGLANKLTGGYGRDWFVANRSHDLLTDRHPWEQAGL
jgi:hypothetical protein